MYKMKFFILCLLTSALFQCFQTPQAVFNDLDDVHIYYRGLFGSQSALPDELGNIVIDMGTASQGRVKMRITDVEITKEDRPSEPGCADICPPRTIITFSCIKAPCVSDPAIDGYVGESGSITIGSHKRGQKVYDFLLAYKKFVENE
ncbi:MAG: hypothetical protein ACI8TA_003270 [Cyclobacteriaceae bacterium]|jgi:hypothetical protein